MTASTCSAPLTLPTVPRCWSRPLPWLWVRFFRTGAPRRKTASDNSGGDSVYWNCKSDLRSGKAYHKGAHLRYQMKKGNIVCTQEQIEMGDRLIRLKLKLGARWFRRLETDWRDLTAENLTEPKPC